MPFEHATLGPHLGEVFVPLKGERKDRASNAFADSASMYVFRCLANLYDHRRIYCSTARHSSLLRVYCEAFVPAARTPNTGP